MRKPNPSPYKARVLIIDDEFLICKSVTEMLRYFGFVADYVQSFSRCLEYLERNPDLDIILLDINLGLGQNGMELLPRIKEKNKYVQVIMFTSEEKLQVGVECIRRGAYDYMTKPFEESVFFDKLPGALERKKLLQLNDVYLGILFHDLKNPLQSIMAGIELLRMSLPPETLTGAQKNAFHRSEIAINQILLMINNIVAVSKLESGTLAVRREPFILQKEVENSLAPFRIAASLRDSVPIATAFFSDTDIRVVSDRDLFCRVLSNIVSNALRFAAEHSVVQIKFSLDEPHLIHVEVTNAGSFIDEAMREAIFHKFSSVQLSLRQSGLQNYGLGLTFSKMAVEALGGRIWITCDKTVPSTTFHFTVSNFSIDTDLKGDVEPAVDGIVSKSIQAKP